jgi:hypothetical protein
MKAPYPAVLGLVALLGSQPLAAAPAKKQVANPDAALTAQARTATANLLRDPGSAQFRNIRVITTILGTKKVCGEVNAKNGFGGYGGFKPFVFYGRAAIASDGRPQDMLDYLSIAEGC